MSSADTRVLRLEARKILKQAMLNYEGDPIHVAIYALVRHRNWNALQADLAETQYPSDPERIQHICDAVENHLESEMRSYLGIGSGT